MEESHARAHCIPERGVPEADLRELVKGTVEEMLNGLLEEEADDLVGAERYERTAEREAYRAEHYDRSLTTSSGELYVYLLSSRA